MKHHKKIKGRAIALRCINDEGNSLIKTDQVYLGFPSSNHNLFELYIPNINKYYAKHNKVKPFHTIPFPKHCFEPINPLHKHNPIYY